GVRAVARRLVRIVNPREVLDLAAPRFGVQSLGVTLFADFQRRVNEDLDEMSSADHIPHVVARRAVRADRRADGHAAVPHDLRSDKSDAADVDVPVGFAEPQTLRKARANDVAIQQRDRAAVFEHEREENLGRRGFARAAQPREPDADSLAMSWRVGLGEYL